MLFHPKVFRKMRVSFIDTPGIEERNKLRDMDIRIYRIPDFEYFIEKRRGLKMKIGSTSLLSVVNRLGYAISSGSAFKHNHSIFVMDVVIKLFAILERESFRLGIIELNNKNETDCES
jgi:hypothetical protein